MPWAEAESEIPARLVSNQIGIPKHAPRSVVILGLQIARVRGQLTASKAPLWRSGWADSRWVASAVSGRYRKLYSSRLIVLDLKF